MQTHILKSSCLHTLRKKDRDFEVYSQLLSDPTKYIYILIENILHPYIPFVAVVSVLLLYLLMPPKNIF